MTYAIELSAEDVETLARARELLRQHAEHFELDEQDDSAAAAGKLGVLVNTIFGVTVFS